MQSVIDITCPISQHIFKDPVVASDGYIYEKTCIDQWFKIKDTSPITNLKVPDKKLTEVFFMKQMVAEMLKYNPELKKDQFECEFEYELIIKSKKFTNLLEFKNIDIAKLVNLLEKYYSIENKVIRDFFSNTAVVKHIIDNCQDLNVSIVGGWRLAHYICWTPSPDECIKHIINKGANFTVLNNDYNTPVHTLFRYHKLISTDLLKFIVDKKININIPELVYSTTGIEFVLKNYDKETIKYVLSQYPDYNCSKHTLLYCLSVNKNFAHTNNDLKSDEVIKFIDYL